MSPFPKVIPPRVLWNPAIIRSVLGEEQTARGALTLSTFSTLL